MPVLRLERTKIHARETPEENRSVESPRLKWKETIKTIL